MREEMGIRDDFIEELEKKELDYVASIGKLKAEIDQLRIEVENKERDAQSLRVELVNIREEHGDLDKRMGLLESEKKRILELEEELKQQQDAADEILRRQAEVDLAQKSHDVRTAQLMKATELLTQGQKKVQPILEREQAVTTREEQVLRRERAVENVEAKQAEQFQSHMKNVKEWRQEISAHKNECEELIQRKDALEKHIEEKEMTHKLKLKEADNQMQEQKDQLTKFGQHLNSLEQILKDRENEIIETEQDLLQRESDVKSREQSVTARERNCQKREELVDETEQNWKKTASTQPKPVGEERDKVLRARAELATVMHQVEAGKKTLLDLKQKLQEEKEELDLQKELVQQHGQKLFNHDGRRSRRDDLYMPREPPNLPKPTVADKDGSDGRSLQANEFLAELYE